MTVRVSEDRERSPFKCITPRYERVQRSTPNAHAHTLGGAGGGASTADWCRGVCAAKLACRARGEAMSIEEATSVSAWLREQTEPLPTLQVVLAEKQGTLDAALTEAMRAEMPNLLDISTSMRATQERLRELATQLDVHHEEATSFSDRVGERLRTFEAAMAERDAVAAQADKVKLLRRLVEALGNVEALVAPAAVARDGDLAGTAGRLRRAGGECGRLALLRRRAAELPPAGQLDARIDRARSALLSQLSECLHRVLAEGEGGEGVAAGGGGGCGDGSDNGALVDVLHGYAEAGAEDEAALWVRSQWVAPRLCPKLSAEAASPSATFASLAAQLVAFVNGPSFEPLARADAAVRRPLHLLCAGPWVAWCQWFGDEMQYSHLFGIGMPDTFHCAYLALYSTLASLDAHLPGESMRHHLRSHAVTATIRRRFQLPIYFQLRKQETIRPFEAALTPPDQPLSLVTSEPGAAEGSAQGNTPATAEPATRAAAGPSPPPPPRLACAASHELVVGMCRGLQPDTFLVPLASRFYRLTLECASRFHTWLAAILPAEPPQPPSALPPALSSPGGAQALYLDLLAIDDWLRSQLAPELGALLRLPHASELIGECVRALEEAAQALANDAVRLRSALVEAQAAECAAVLAQVRVIPRMYHMTGKEPTQPSFFIGKVFEPLQAFLQDDGGGGVHRQGLAAGERADWARAVASRVTKEYCGVAATTLDDVRKKEEALHRMRKVAATAAEPPSTPGAGGAQSDADKIATQMCLDVQAYSAQLRTAGVDPSALAEYAELQEAVRPVGGVLSQLELDAPEGHAPAADPQQPPP